MLKTLVAEIMSNDNLMLLAKTVMMRNEESHCNAYIPAGIYFSHFVQFF